MSEKPPETIEIIDELKVEPSTRAVVIGGGVMGALAALRLVERGIETEVFDRLPEGATKGNASYAAAAQVLPFVSGENPAINTVDIRKNLPLQISYLPITLQGFSTSKKYYETLLDNKESGVTPIQLIEPKDPEAPWEGYLNRIMDPWHRAMWKPVDLEIGDGSIRRYWDYYQCDTMAIDPVRTLAYFRDQFLQKGGIWHYGTQVTPRAVNSFRCAPLVIAAGMETPSLYDSVPYPTHIRTGMTVQFTAVEPLPELPMLSYDDIVLKPHASDRRRLDVGGLDIEKDYGGNEQVAIRALMRRAREVAQAEIGPWTGFSSELLDSAKIEVRIGKRVMGMLGIRVMQDSRTPHIVTIEDTGSIGWTLAPYSTDLAARFTEEILQDFRPGKEMKRNDLLVPTGASLCPFEPRSSLREMQRNPSKDLKTWEGDGDTDYSELLLLLNAMGVRELAVEIHKLMSSGPSIARRED